MAAENNFVQPAIPKFDGHYDHWSMLMENFLRSKEYWSLVEIGITVAAKGRMNGHGGDEQALKVTYDDRIGGRGGDRAHGLRNNSKMVVLGKGNIRLQIAGVTQ
ncbi:Retrovirus-related Pol polyprotein from transposon RE1, partial [Fagus crenata]